MWAEEDRHSHRDWPQLWGGGGGLVMTAMRIGLFFGLPISVLPESVESTKLYLFIRSSEVQAFNEYNV